MLAGINKINFVPGDEVEITLDFEGNEDLLDDLKLLNINFLHVGLKRTTGALGFGELPQRNGEKICIRRNIPENFSNGVYAIGAIKLFYDENHEKTHLLRPGKEINQLYFSVSSEPVEEISEAVLQKRLRELHESRMQFINSETITEQARLNPENVRNYVVLTFGVGCLIHSPQNLQGYSLYPLGEGYSYDHMLEAVNHFTTAKHGIALDKIDSIQDSFGRATPLFAIEYHNVIASDPNNSVAHCSKISEQIFTVLAFEKGQRPNIFATVVIDKISRQSWQSFHFPGYRGNLVSSFNSASTALMLEEIIPKIQTSPWLDLLMRSYADALNERNPNIACLKYWAILEMISKRYVTDNNVRLYYPSGDEVLKGDGTPYTTRDALGKVYKHLLASNLPPINHSSGVTGLKCIFETFEDARENPNCGEETIVVTLWEVLSALYEIRNSTAHSGEFNIESARAGSIRQRMTVDLLERFDSIFMSQVEGVTKKVVSNEFA